MRTLWLNAFAIAAVVIAVTLVVVKNIQGDAAALLRWSELVVSSERVIRERLPDDPPCTAMLLYDLEGELFFGAAPELDRCSIS